MRTALSKAKDTVDTNGIPMINFAKWTELYTCIKDVLRHKPPDVSDYRQTKAGVLAYLECQLRGISLDSTMDQDLEEIGIKLREEEEQIHQLADQRFNDAGIT